MERTVRRLAALLAADVVGYSGKIEADESSTLAALKDVQATTIDPLLAENSGRIVKTMGDGFIAEFGSVVDAVTFAVAMQKSVPERQQGTAPEKRLVYRIGINLGDVVVEGERSARRRGQRRGAARADLQAGGNPDFRHSLRPTAGQARIAARLHRRATG